MDKGNSLFFINLLHYACVGEEVVSPVVPVRIIGVIKENDVPWLWLYFLMQRTIFFTVFIDDLNPIILRGYCPVFEQVNTRAPMVEKNPEFCERARENLQILDTKARVTIRNEQGEKHFLSAEEKAEQRQAALDTIAEHCD